MEKSVSAGVFYKEEEENQVQSLWYVLIVNFQFLAKVNDRKYISVSTAIVFCFDTIRGQDVTYICSLMMILS